MAGAGYKLFTTGQVLTAAEVNTYLQEQVIMVFNDATARTTALSGVLAEGMVSYLKSTKVVEIYNGTAWASLDDPNAIQNTIVDAKGDLITATANDTPARLAVGNSGETIVADSSTATGLRYNPQNALANPIINGGFDIWQRGTSFSITSGSQSFLTCDRWWGYRNATGGTISRQNTSDSTNLPNIQYCARVQRDNGNTSTTAMSIVQSLESVNSIPFAGRTVTLSLYARAGANFSASSSALNVQLLTGTGTDQNVINAYTGVATPINQNVTLTTTWQRFAISATIPTTTTEFAISVQYTPTGTAGANDWFEVTGVQIDLGTYTASSAPTFRRSGGTLAGEFLACCRYFQRLVNGAELTNETITMTQAFSTTQAYGTKQFLVPMRAAPTISYSNNTHFMVKNAAGGDTATTAMSSATISARTTNITLTVASGLVAGNAAWLLANNASATMDASSEL